MMVDYAAARAIVVAELSAHPRDPDDEFIVLDVDTIERDWGWVFFYDSRRSRESDGDADFAIAGNAPYFVRRSDGAMFVAGTALPVEEYIVRFERNGNFN